MASLRSCRCGKTPFVSFCVLNLFLFSWFLIATNVQIMQENSLHSKVISQGISHADFGAQEFASCGLEWLVCSGRVLPLTGHIEFYPTWSWKTLHLPQKTHKRFKATVATFVFVGNFDVLQVHHMTFQDKYVFTFRKGACQLFFQRFGEWEIRYDDDSSKKAKGRHLKLRKPEARIAWVLRVSIHCV